MNHCVKTYQWSCRSFEEEEDDEIAVLPISIADSDHSSDAGIVYG